MSQIEGSSQKSSADPKQRSKCWEYFDREVHEGEKKVVWAICKVNNICKFKVKLNASFSTSGMKRHLQSTHKVFLETQGSLAPAASIGTLLANAANVGADFLYLITHSPTTKFFRPLFKQFHEDKFDSLLTAFVAECDLPLQVVQADSFRALMEYMRKNAPVRSSHQMRGLVEKEYGLKQSKIKSMLQVKRIS